VAPSTLVKLDDYRAVAPRGAVDFLMRMGEGLRGRRFVHVSASRYGGVIAETLNRLVPILNNLGIETAWDIVIGGADFDATVGALAKALSGTEQVIPPDRIERLRADSAANAPRLALDGDLVVTHGVAPLLIVDARPASGRWVWRHHDDLSSPQPAIWTALRPFVQRYDAVVLSLAKFAPPLSVPRFLIQPSIDPLSERNRDMSRAEQATVLDRLGVPRDKPILLHVGPFDRSRDPLGAINVFRLVKKHHDARLVVAGSGPSDPGVTEEARDAASREPDVQVLALPPDPQLEINALERACTVLVHKPLRADFGLDVAAAMWKGKPVVGSLAGGVPFQIVPHTTGYTVDSVEGAAFRIRHLLSNPELIGRMGAAGREHVRRNFLITRHLGDYLALLAHLTS
jgi:trehalose synthase